MAAYGQINQFHTEDAIRGREKHEDRCMLGVCFFFSPSFSYLFFIFVHFRLSVRPRFETSICAPLSAFLTAGETTLLGLFLTMLAQYVLL